MKKLIIFDYDGVLADSLNTVISSVNNIGKELGLDISLSESDFWEIEDMTYGEIIRKAGVPNSILPEFVARLFKSFSEASQRTKLFVGIYELIKNLSKENTIAIVSGNAKKIIEEKFLSENLLSEVAVIWGADAPGDKAEKITRTMDMCSIDRMNTFMVGDASSDIHFAKKAGVKSVAVSWGWQHVNSLGKMNPDFIINSPEQLLEIIKN
jgi:phosphoglycolate phosphatase